MVTFNTTISSKNRQYVEDVIMSRVGDKIKYTQHMHI